MEFGDAKTAIEQLRMYNKGGDTNIHHMFVNDKNMLYKLGQVDFSFSLDSLAFPFNASHKVLYGFTWHRDLTVDHQAVWRRQRLRYVRQKARSRYQNRLQQSADI